MKQEIRLDGTAILKCVECGERTKHKLSGFSFYNRRYVCSKCGYESWDGRTPMEAPIE